ncbi:MAG: hypothetical protein ACOWW1_09285 [archaeon]|nr:hypothetical protein [Candidatus Bathyarchaeum sp.]
MFYCIAFSTLTIHKEYIILTTKTNVMDSIEFYFSILPLAGLIGLLVLVIGHLARKDKTINSKELKTINELMQTGTLIKETLQKCYILYCNKV